MLLPKLWKRFTLFALVGLLLGLLISCVPGPSSSDNKDGKAEVEFWTMQLQPEYNDYFNGVIKTFETENPGVKVKWVDVPWAAIQSKILSAVSANKAPDLGRFAVIQDPQGAVLSIIAYTSPESQKIA